MELIKLVKEKQFLSEAIQADSSSLAIAILKKVRDRKLVKWGKVAPFLCLLRSFFFLYKVLWYQNVG